MKEYRAKLRDHLMPDDLEGPVIFADVPAPTQSKPLILRLSKLEPGIRETGTTDQQTLADSENKPMAQNKEENNFQGIPEPAREESGFVSNDQQYHKMVDEVVDYAIILLDKDGIIQNWNKGAERIKQYTREEAVGKHFSIFYLPDDRSNELPDKLLRIAAAEGRALHEGWRLRKDGTRFWGSITVTALHSENNEIIGYSKVTRDLTERKSAEDQLKAYAEQLQQKNEALRISEERYHKMVDEVQDYAIILLNEDGVIQNWNAGAEKIKGYTEEEIIGQNFAVFYTAQDQQINLPQQLLKEATEFGKALHEGWRVTKNGSMFWGSIVITALHKEDGSLMGFSKVTRDLTARKKAEDQLKENLSVLEKQNQELDQFAFAASHDLQEPLRKILNFADLIEKHVSDEKVVARYVKKISESSLRMRELIKAVLDFSRLGKDITDKIPTDLNTVLIEVLADFELMLEQKDATVEWDPLPVIAAVPIQIYQLFSNLIGNALKFSLERPLIRISFTFIQKEQLPDPRSTTNDGQYLKIVFADNGIGFDAQYEQLIFLIFQRLHSKHEYEGTGIGLALCKKVMDNHGGLIAAEGNPGKGASFILYFPVG